MTATENTPHIAMFPFPAQGHIPPLVHLARKLAAEGCIITLINIDSIHTKLSQHWLSPPGADIRLCEVTCDVKMPEGMSSEGIKDLKSAMEAIVRLETPVGELLRSLEPPPCCLIADFVVPSWPARLAKELNMCPVAYWPGNAAWSSLHQHQNLILSRGDGFRDGLGGTVIDYVPGIDSIKFEELPDYFRVPFEVNRYIFDSIAERMNDSEWALVNSMVELEPKTFKAMEEALVNRSFVSVGPLFPLSSDANSSLGVSLRDENFESLKWLDVKADKSVLYISFGSIGTLAEEAFEELAAGLEASKQPFVWVIRMDLVDGSRAKEKYNEFVERTQEQGLIVSWAPQVQVLSHGSVGGFLSHCGWNSTFESLCHGVPILGWPLFGEQHLNCKLVADDWKLGKWLSNQPQVGREDVKEKILEFMQQGGGDMGEIRSRVNDFRDTAWRTVNEGGTSHTNLERFVSAMKSRVK